MTTAKIPADIGYLAVGPIYVPSGETVIDCWGQTWCVYVWEGTLKDTGSEHEMEFEEVAE